MDTTIKAGLDYLVSHDRYLLEYSSSERSITHRLGLYYQDLFRDWDVDCEFNLSLGGPKEISIDPKEFLRYMADVLRGNGLSRPEVVNILEYDHVSMEDVRSLIKQLDSPIIEHDMQFDVVLHVLELRDRHGRAVKIKKPVYPDIIVHERETNNNLIVVEAKKSSNRIPSARLYDLVKLWCLRQAPFDYRYAYFVEIPVMNSFKLHEDFILRPILGGRVTEVKSDAI